GVELRIAEPDGGAVAPGEAGEICVRGPVVSPGYRGAASGGQGARPGGWFRTGDLGRMDEQGFLTVLDRRDDLVISGGENVYPAEVERALAAHPDVLEAAVAGRPDDEWGAVVVGMVVRRPHAPADEKALIAHCRDRLAAYKAPRLIRFVDRLPRNSLGKVMRREVARAFETNV
ncbi:MAG: class I adenylate-forming enzyme family protein, partial [Myxococcota bacterium]